MGYAADPAWVERDLDTYGQDAVSVIFRPSTPDCESAEELRAKVDLARERGYAASTSTTTASCAWTRWTGSTPRSRELSISGGIVRRIE